MIKKTLLAIFGVLLLSFGVFAVPAFAEVGTEACEGYSGDFKEELCGGGNKGGEAKLMGSVGGVLNVIYGLVGIISVVFVIVGGFKFTTSQGDPGKVAQAKNTIMFSLIGLVVTLGAFAITSFVLKALGGS